jgi:gliding motility-associated-like protein
MLFLSVANHTVSAQLCQGSLGDPIVNITFGAGANPGASLPGATTNYQYVSNDCPGDGFYTVRNNTSNCFSSTWHSLPTDHTGDANGYFMLVNSSVQPSAFYIDTVSLFCNNTTYEFSAWVINILKPTSCGGNGIKPNLTFSIERIDGTVIQTFNSGNIEALNMPVWNKYGFFFATPANVNKVVVKIINNAAGGCGNDLALDDITFRPCGPKITASSGGNNSVNFCIGKDTTVTMTASAGGFSNPHYQWQESVNGGITWSDIPLANNISYSKTFLSSTPAGDYLYRLTAAELINTSFPQCRVSSDIISVSINTKPVTSVSNSSPVCAGNNIQLTVTGGNGYTWTGPNGFTSSSGNPVINNAQTIHGGEYFVSINTTQGCAVFDSTTVVIHPKPIALTSAAVVKFCKGGNIQLSVSGGTSYKWMPVTGLTSGSINNPVASPADSTQYIVEVKNAFGCADTTSIQVHVVPSPIANAGPDKTIISGQSVFLNGSVLHADSFYWSPPLFINNINSLIPFVDPPNDNWYILQALSNAGCGSASDSVFVKVFQKLVVPNAFSPNGDGINDTWQIPALSSYPNHEFMLFDRYGRQLFKTNAYKAWDGNINGKPLPVATYYYLINLQNNMPPISGSIVILR